MNNDMESNLKKILKEATGAVPWYFKLAWVIGMILGITASIGLIALLVSLIRHLW